MEGIYEVLFHICTWMVAIQADFCSKTTYFGEFLSDLSQSLVAVLPAGWHSYVTVCMQGAQAWMLEYYNTTYSVVLQETYQSFQDFVVDIIWVQ